jgi:hypothetical protein
VRAETPTSNIRFDPAPTVWLQDSVVTFAAPDDLLFALSNRTCASA